MYVSVRLELWEPALCPEGGKDDVSWPLHGQSLDQISIELIVFNSSLQKFNIYNGIHVSFLALLICQYGTCV
jgi:hypothetical protein